MGLLAPWFLAGLAALGVPVFVHMLRRHVTVPRPVSSLMFFERGTQSSTKHRRLRYLLLFALRIALVLFIILAFADPFVRRSAADANGHLLLIVLDDSFSMRAGNHFTDAKQKALATLASKSKTKRAQIMALGGQLRILTQPAVDDAQLRSALEGVEPGDGHASLGELGRALRTMAETVHEPIDLHLFSDLQRTAMPANFADMVLPENVTLHLHPSVDGAGGSVQPNWTIESVEAPAELADPKDPIRSRVKAVVVGLHTPTASRSVSLIVNGKTIATKQVDVPANGRATVEFSPLEVAYGFNRCEVRVEGGDAFPGDDASLFAVRRSDPERVLFVHASGETRSTLYFNAALGAATQGSFLLQSVAAEQATDLDPSKYAFVVLSDAEALPSLFEHALEQYVTKGGSVLIALGTSAHGHIPLWPAPVKETRNYASGGGPSSVGEVDFTHPALAEAQPGKDNGGWAETSFFYAASVEPGDARVIAKLSDGTPLLLDRPSGEGHILLLTSGLENLTNDLPLHPVFVAFVDRTARFLSGNERLSGSRIVDSFVQLRSATPAAQSTSVEVIDPAGQRPLSLTEARTAQTLRLEHAGFYQIRLADGRNAVLGVNPDRRESDLEPIPEETQKLWAGSGTSAPTQVIDSTAPAKTQPVSLWWWVMLLALGVAVAESVLASGYMGTEREQA